MNPVKPKSVLLANGMQLFGVGSALAGTTLTTGGTRTVKGSPGLVPPAVVTVTVRAPAVAAAAITKLAVNDVLLATLTLLTVTPPPETFTVVAPTTKLVPVNVTGTVVPWMP